VDEPVSALDVSIRPQIMNGSLYLAGGGFEALVSFAKALEAQDGRQ
jgi:hypothetical protein